VYVTAGDTIQMQELTLTRGFQSSVAPVLYFGLNNAESIDEIRVVWTNGKEQKLTNTKVNQELIFEENNAAMPENTINPPQEERLFTQADSTVFPQFKHVENTYDDFKDQVLLPHKMSEFGPALAVGDVNNDGLEDYYVGGAKDEEAALFMQTTNGINRVDLNVFQSDKGYEDVDAVFFDADGDGFQDLYVVSGGYEFAKKPQLLNDRLYLNDQKGNFKAVANALPKLQSSGSKVYAEDFDGDGKQDLLVLGRQIPGKYPEPASSFLLKNTGTTGKPRFEIDSEMQPEAFTDLGMATAASVSDFNQDGRADIVIVGEWMPIRFFENTTNGFVEVTNDLLAEDTTGWWWSIASGDFDGDGDTDYILGNNGLNYKYKASKEEPFDIYAGDFDNNENEDIVLGYYNDGKQYPLRGRQCSSQQIPGIKQKFKDYASFSEATLDEVYSEKVLNSSLHYQVKSFASIYLENKNGKMVVHQLPRAAQLSSVTSILVEDFNKDGNLDAVLAGNLYQSEIETPRNDASRGVFLAGDGKGNFTALRPAESGIFIPGDVKNLKRYQLGDETYILAAKNSDYLQALKLN